jgi:hypothetical protein
MFTPGLTRRLPAGVGPLLALALLPSVLPALPACGAGDDKGPAWPLVPLTRPAVPPVRDRAWVRNPLDAFVLARLERAGLRPNPPADPLTLLRRVTFDLTGLAPTPAERADFLADRAPDVYGRLVERLLASPHYGERWAQHWLDVVRYAETDGFKTDRVRPETYRYRDYVIRAFNEDLPYDRFAGQQLAGDELEPANPEALVATGFFRLPPEEANASNYRLMRQDLLDDVTDVTGLAFLGLTVGCARCHDHKFDPLTQKDYYRLQAFFAPLIHRDLPLATPGEQARHAQQLARWKEATRPIRAEMAQLLEPARRAVFEELLVIFDPQTRQALRTPAGERTAVQRQLAALAGKQLDRRYARLTRRLGAKERARYDELQKRLADFDVLRPAPLPVAMAVTDVGPAAPATHRLAGGNYLRPREEVHPGFPECLEPGPADVRPAAGGAVTSGRRSALARWLCRPDHPLTARVIANRLWQHHLGQGIVATPNDFGAMGAGATHPELLDWLAAELVARGWRLKGLHRLIVTSATYCQASQPERNADEARAARVDPSDKLLWHARVKRREAESLRDVALQVSGRLNARMFGPSAQLELPAPLAESRYAWDPDERPEDRDRRSVYVLARRNLPYPLFGAFDLPDRHTSCPARAETITATQALVMLNGEFSLDQARRTAGRLLASRGGDPRALIREAYRTLLGREPAGDEAAAAAEFLERQERLIVGGGRPRGRAADPAPAGVSPARAAAVVDLCHALLNSAEFLYVE